MLAWGNGNFTDDPRAIFDGALSSLIRIYLTDKDSPYRDLRHHTAIRYEKVLAVITRAIGDARISALTFRDFKRWHEKFRQPQKASESERVAYAHTCMTFVRIVLGFGALLKLPGCADAKSVISEMEFELPQKRTCIITREQATALRIEAHKTGRRSIALAQAVQFELGIRQKDTIGEWVPVSEPGMSAVVSRGEKWMCGIDWSEIDDSFILTHRLSKSLDRKSLGKPQAGKIKVWNLLLYPMIVEELCCIAGVPTPDGLRRDLFPASGPLVVAEHTARPWRQKFFAEKWRQIASAAEIPDTVQNRDSRAGAATEAENAGADVEQIRKALGHSRPDTTRIYTRADTEATAKVAVLRVQNIKKKPEK